MLARYQMFAGYNAWCNERLYQATAEIPDADYRANRGAFFQSLHGTLNHLLVGDRIWMRRFTSQGEAPPSLDAILFDNFAQLRAARRLEDDRTPRLTIFSTIKLITGAKPTRCCRLSSATSVRRVSI